MSGPSLIHDLIKALRCLPGVGPKTAQRMAYHLVERDRDGARQLGTVLLEAVEQIGRCRFCQNLSESEVCSICSSNRRDRSLLCVVETPADMTALDQATQFQGLYFVLMGHLSPLDGIGPNELGLDSLDARLQDGTVKEMIIATNSTVEGEATAHYISKMAHVHGVRATRIAHGVPIGGELEYIDTDTLAHAFSGRRDI